MTNKKEVLKTLEKVLILLKGDEVSELVIKFAGYLFSHIKPEVVKEIILMHVIEKDFIEKLALNVDIRIEAVKEEPALKKIIEEYKKEKIYPILEKAEIELKQKGVKCKTKKELREGDCAKEVIKYLELHNIHTVIIGKKPTLFIEDYLPGSCSNAIIHFQGADIVFIIEKELDIDFPPYKILIAVDDSAYLFNILKKIGELLLLFVSQIEHIVILHVIDEESSEKIQKAKILLEKAKKELIEKGINQALIELTISTGDAGKEIVKTAEEKKTNIIILGKRSKSILRDIVLGSVALKVVRLDKKQIVVIINP